MSSLRTQLQKLVVLFFDTVFVQNDKIPFKKKYFVQSDKVYKQPYAKFCISTTFITTVISQLLMSML